MNTIFIILICVIILCLLSLYIYKESTGFTVTTYEFINNKLKSDSYHFVMISDLHDGKFGDNNCELLNAIDEIGPDAVYFAGDLITSGMELSYDYTSTINFIKTLSSKYPIYYGIGNHEEKLKRCPHDFPGKWEEYTGILEQFGVHILQNEVVCNENAGIKVYGLDLEYKYFRKLKKYPIEDDYLEKIFGKCDDSYLTILLAHFPDQFPEYSSWGSDYILSGHVHGGVIRLPFLGGVISPQLKLFPKYDSGLFRNGNTTMILSRGIGSHTIPIRVNNKAEIVNVIIKKEK